MERVKRWSISDPWSPSGVLKAPDTDPLEGGISLGSVLVMVSAFHSHVDVSLQMWTSRGLSVLQMPTFLFFINCLSFK